jgi:hypothetical protein
MQDMMNEPGQMPPMAPDAAQQPGMAPDMGGQPQQASPEEQALYDKIVGQAMNLVYDKEFMPQVIEMLKGEGDPVEGLARTAALVIARIATSGEKAGVQMKGDVLHHAGTEILEDLAELSREADVKDYSEDPDALEAAYFRALDMFRVMMQDAGRIKPETAQKDMAMLQEMDQSGKLEAMLRGLSQNDPRKAKAGAQAPMPEDEAMPPKRGLMPEAV